MLLSYSLPTWYRSFILRLNEGTRDDITAWNHLLLSSWSFVVIHWQKWIIVCLVAVIVVCMHFRLRLVILWVKILTLASSNQHTKQCISHNETKYEVANPHVWPSTTRPSRLSVLPVYVSISLLPVIPCLFLLKLRVGCLELIPSAFSLPISSIVLVKIVVAAIVFLGLLPVLVALLGLGPVERPVAVVEGVRFLLSSLVVLVKTMLLVLLAPARRETTPTSSMLVVVLGALLSSCCIIFFLNRCVR